MENQIINLQLDVNSVDFILHALGELPSKTGAWELIGTIRNQALPQLPKEDPADNETNDVVETA
jgi:hypothetical protein